MAKTVWMILTIYIIIFFFFLAEVSVGSHLYVYTRLGQKGYNERNSVAAPPVEPMIRGPLSYYLSLCESNCSHETSSPDRRPWPLTV